MYSHGQPKSTHEQEFFVTNWLQIQTQHPQKLPEMGLFEISQDILGHAKILSKIFATISSVHW